MTVLSGQTIRKLQPIENVREKYVDQNGCSCGLSIAGYDITLAESVEVAPGGFSLAAAAERFNMSGNIIGFVHDKSSLARKGLQVQNTVVEPGWRGYLTLELTNHTDQPMYFEAGSAIAQVVFHFTDEFVEQPYNGKYQDQKRGVQAPLKEDGSAL